MGWVDADRFLEEASSTWATVPLTARERVLERQRGNRQWNDSCREYSDSPEAIYRRALRRARRLGA